MAITALATAGAETLLPAVIGSTVDAVVGGGAPSSLLWWSALLVAVLVACDTVDDLAAAGATARATGWLRRAMVRHVLRLGTRTGKRFSTGDLTTRLVANTADAGRMVPDIVRAGANLIPALGGIVALALIDPWLCLTFLAGLPVFVLLIRSFARDASDLAARYMRIQGEIAGRLVDALAGSRTIAAAGTVEREARRVLAPLSSLRKYGEGMWRAQTRIAAQDALLVPLLEIAVLVVAGAELARGRITPGQMLAASQYVVLATMVGAAVPWAVRLARGRAAGGRAAEVLGERAPDHGETPLPPGPGRIEFRGVTARVRGVPVLVGLDLVVPAGALLGVVGRSGAGKSLLAALAGGLVDPDEGEVTLEGVALHDIDSRELRGAIGYGFERPVLLGETLTDAISLGRHRSTGEVVAAARAARADGFIRRMPEGYRTRLADAPMSAGEIQRIGLARAFAHGGRVLILDDVAASLDTVTEHHISGVLTGALAGCTRIVVAHRASTAARMDEVAWLDRGAIRARAPHELLWRDPSYRALFEPEDDVPDLARMAPVAGRAV